MLAKLGVRARALRGARGRRRRARAAPARARADRGTRATTTRSRSARACASTASETRAARRRTTGSAAYCVEVDGRGHDRGRSRHRRSRRAPRRHDGVRRCDPGSRSRREIELMRAAGATSPRCSSSCASSRKPGVTTGELDAHRAQGDPEARRRVVVPRLRRRGPAAVSRRRSACRSTTRSCTASRGQPRELEEGDIVELDFGVVVSTGFYGDSAFTVAVGERRSPEAAAAGSRRRARALDRGIEQMVPGNRLVGHRPRGADVRRGARASRWCASSSDTASAARCTSSRRCRTSAGRAAACGSSRVWCSRSSRW